MTKRTKEAQNKTSIRLDDNLAYGYLVTKN